MAYFECIIGGAGTTLTVTCDSAFAGKTITCTDGTTTLTAVCPSASPYVVEFDLETDGTWTISGTISGTTHSTSITIETSATLHEIPNGSTVTPVANIQTWLHCANIWDKSYTTISQVLADTTTLLALISSNNAADYMARSTSWASAVVANSTAMGYIGNNDYAADTLLADATWLEAIVNSEYIELVLNVKVPSMTGYTTPSGQCFASSEYSGEPAWSPFQGNGGQWSTSASNTSPGYIGYKFTQAVQIKALYVKTRFTSGANTIKLQYSDDNSVWNDTTAVFTPTGSYPQETKMAVESNYGEHLYWRLYYTANSASYKSTNKIQFWGRG